MRNKWKKTFLVLGIWFLVVGVGLLALQWLYQENQLDVSFSYDIEQQMYGTQDKQLYVQKAKAYASDFCVSAHNIGLNGLSFSQKSKVALFNLEETTVEFAHNIHEKAYPASITKIMTAIIALKYGNLEDMVTISKNAINLEEGSMELGFRVGDEISLYELLHGLLIFSGNDAAMAIAEHIGGTTANFVEMMNEEAKLLGATNTHFVNPSGLHDENHYTTAYDIYLMLEEALKYDVFVKLIQLENYNLTFYRNGEKIAKRIDATDQYLTNQVTPPKNVTVLGGKTGTTSDAGSCLALVSQNAYGEVFISIVLKASTKTQLYDYMNQFLSQINL